MREQAFENFLTMEPNITSRNAIQYRIVKGRKAEDILGTSLDVIVSDDDRMYTALVELAKHESSNHNQLQHAVRKYYKFVNNKEFPRMRTYTASI